MRKLILAVALTLTLGGCAEIQKLRGAFQAVTGNIVSPQQVAAAISAFDAGEALATNYVKLPRCGTGPVVCRDPATTAAVAKWVKAGRVDRNQLKAALRANPGQNLSVADIYNDLGNTTAALSAALAGK
jgi:hypothetical protein